MGSIKAKYHNLKGFKKYFHVFIPGEMAPSICQGDDRFLSDPPAGVVVTALNDYNVALQLRIWLKDERSHMAARFELREQLFEALRSAQVDMPFETFSLTPVELNKMAVGV